MFCKNNRAKQTGLQTPFKGKNKNRNLQIWKFVHHTSTVKVYRVAKVNQLLINIII